jgi:hypothetical protein
MPVITEPTFEHYVYYLRRVEGDNREAIQERRAAFEGELKALLVHLKHLSGQTIPTWEWPQESEDRRVSQRIVHTGWLDNSATGRSCFVEARTYGDVYWLQVGYCQRGRAGPEIFASLRDEAWQPSATDHLLGSSIYLCGIAAEGSDDLAVQAMTAYTGNMPDMIASTRLANCCAGLYGSPPSPHVTVLFYPNAECEDWVGRTILNDIALRFELYKHKADRQLAWCEENFPILSEQERALQDLLEQVSQPSLPDLEPLRRLIPLYRVFNGNVGMLIERQKTIGISLDNLDAVLRELGALAEDRLLSATRDHLRQCQRQLEADLNFADQARQQAGAAINAIRAELGLDRLVDLHMAAGEATHEAELIERRGFLGVSPQDQSIIPCPRISTPSRISLATRDKTLLQHVFRGYDKVLVEKAFSGGYSGTQVLLTLPVKGGLNAARKVTKLGFTLELRRERDKYERYVKPFLPFCTAGIEQDEYYEQDSRAGLNYYFVGGGALGQVMDLEQYYRTHTADQIIKTLNDLLDRELRQRWYELATPLEACFFADEYGRHIIEHLRLELDALWTDDPPPAMTADYRRIAIDAIPREYEAIQPNTHLLIEGLVVTRVKHGEVKLQAPNSPGTVVRVQFDPGSEVAQGLRLESVVNMCGKVLYNRRGRLEQIVRAIFSDLKSGLDSPYIELPGVLRSYPNPLQVYPEILDRTLEGRASYIHGDLHLRNILVDEWGKGWLIDFAKVTKRHILFDFIKLEVYVRLMELADCFSTFSLDDYALFEEALADATLGREDGVTCPDNPDLQVAYQVILAIRHIARNCMARKSDFLTQYFPALFLYCLAVTKYYQEDEPEPTRLAFATACVLGHYLPEIGHQAHPPVPSIRPRPRPPSVDSHLATGRRWAVMVGVNAYQDRDISDLTCCVADVQDVHCLLTDAAHGDYRARLLLDTTSDTLPIRSNVLAELTNVARAADEEDLLLFYFSGHGATEAGEAYLIPCDARLVNLADTAIPVRRIKEIMINSAARAKVILLDACHSGARIGKAEVRMSPEFMERVFVEAEGLAILASCQQGQVSYEWEQAGQSVFTHYLLEGLAGAADFDNKRFVTIQDVNRYVADRVKAWAVERGRSQTPTLGGGWSGDIAIAVYQEERT